MKDLEFKQVYMTFFQTLKGNLLQSQRQNSAQIRTHPIFIVVLVTCRNEEDPIKNEGCRVLTRLYDVFFRRSRATNSKVSGGILPKFELIQAFIVVLFTCKNEEDPIKNEGARVLTRFPHYKSMGIFSDAQWQLTPKSLVESA